MKVRLVPLNEAVEHAAHILVEEEKRLKSDGGEFSSVVNYVGVDGRVTTATLKKHFARERLLIAGASARAQYAIIVVEMQKATASQCVTWMSMSQAGMDHDEISRSIGIPKQLTALVEHSAGSCRLYTEAGQVIVIPNDVEALEGLSGCGPGGELSTALSAAMIAAIGEFDGEFGGDGDNGG